DGPLNVERDELALLWSGGTGMTLTRRKILASTLATTAAGIVACHAASANAETVAAGAAPAGPPGSGLPALTPEYKAAVAAALDSKPDLWGNQLLALPESPTYDNM